MKNNREKLKERILIFLLITLLLLIVGILLIVTFNKEHLETQNLYSINIRGYTLDNEFHPLIYEYNTVVNEDIIEISCNTDSKIEGCDTKLDLSNKSMYTHKIKIFDGKKTNIYKINITKKTNSENENNDFYI